jgi:hypothetical protein
MRPRAFPLLFLASALAGAADIPFTKVTIDPASPIDPWMKTAGDFTGDGQPDIMVCGASGPLVLYAWPDWKKSVIANGASSQSGSAAVDIDGDGDLDIVIGTEWYENPLKGGKPGSLPWAGHSLGSGGTHDITAVDLDKDVRIDIVMRGEATHDLNLFRQGADGKWTRKDIPYSMGYNGLATGDLDKDGDPDLIVPGAWLENPGGDFASGEWEPHAIGKWDDFAAIAAADLNADGRPDVVMTYSESAGKVSWFECPPDPKAGKWIEHPIDAGPVTNAHSVEIADIDRDGDPDVITSEYEGEGRLLIYANEGKDANWKRQAIGSGKLHNIRVIDIGKDGDLDIIGAYAWGVNPVELWRNDLPPAALPAHERMRTLPATSTPREIRGRAVRSLPATPVFRLPRE